MSAQEEGLAGRLVGKMIRRSVRARFRNLYWQPPETVPPAPVIFACNHHGWHDGYIMFHVVSALGRRSLDWIAEFDAFPLFAKAGGMPFPPDKPEVRAATVRRTIRLMKEEQRSLMLFCEAHLHRGPELLPFGKSLELVASKVPGVTVLPTAIRYEMAMHERPEAFVGFGAPVPLGPDLCGRTRLAVRETLDRVVMEIGHAPERFQILARGTLDVNERMDMRRFRR